MKLSMSQRDRLPALGEYIFEVLAEAAWICAAHNQPPLGQQVLVYRQDADEYHVMTARLDGGRYAFLPQRWIKTLTWWQIPVPPPVEEE